VKSSTVTYLNNQIKSCLETTFVSIYINGEISNLVNHSSGHSYFVIKDKYSSIKCVLFKGNKHKINISLENGAKVEIKGAMTVYSPRGEYQIICSNIELFGKGDLYSQHEALKKDLLAKGYFDESKKKIIPKFLNHIVIITSGTGAVIQDIFNVATKRWPLIHLQLIDTIVQGTNGGTNIVASIKKAHIYKPDVILLARGGGSIEDLWSFNEQIVADAIFKAIIPIVSAIGHESDFVISDLVSDKRAPTPSASMEILLPDQNEYIQYIDDLKSQMTNAIKKILLYKENQLNQLRENTKIFILQNQFDYINTDIKDTKQAFLKRLENILYTKEQYLPNINHLYKNIINTKILSNQQQLDTYKKLFIQYNPQSIPTKGKAKILKNNNLISLKDISIDDTFSLQDTNCTLKAKAISKNLMTI
jgi:exodeoxyribonuclease VII large subunit